MKRATGTKNQDKGIDLALDFIRDNELAQEVDGKPVITSKGEELLNRLGESVGLSGSNLGDGS